MNSGYLSQYFESVAVKTLRAVEVNIETSHQHEFNGTKELKRVIRTTETTIFPTKFIWMGKENEGIAEDTTVKWYDSRKNQPHRSPEFRLYFPSNEVMRLAREGDTMFIARRTDDSLLIVITQSETTIERQLYWLFNLTPPQGNLFSLSEIDEGEKKEIDFSGRFILEELGLEIEEPENDFIDKLLQPFVGSFPSTTEFSAFARDTLYEEVDIQGNPDEALLKFMSWEEKLFRRLERYNVSLRLKEGFTNETGEDVEGFISYSLSVQNRRKSRAGNAFEDHVKYILTTLKIRFSKGQVTENKSRPDFLFPSASLYHNSEFPIDLLTMLAVKTSLKDRWRQVLSEAGKIPNKHLLTIEPGISEFQTNEMNSQNLTLVVPKGIHPTYSISQQARLLDFASFIKIVLNKQIKSLSLGY